MDEIIYENKNVPNDINMVDADELSYALSKKKCVIKIIVKDINGNIIKVGSGFFCKIPIRTNYLNVLLTNNHILNHDFFNNNEELTIEYLKKNKRLNLKNRYIYTNAGKDFTIIEILEEDSIEDFYEVDDFIFEKEYYKNKIIGIIQYPQGEKTQYSHGKIIEINNYLIKHTVATEHGSSGSPIFLMNNAKIVGIHQGYKPKQNINTGIFINDIIENINFIKCIYDIKNINEGTQILNNEYDIVDTKIINENDTKIINEEVKKLEMYIITTKKNFCLKYQFTEKGKQTIILKCNQKMTDMGGMFSGCSSLTS